jgi:pantoate--beta-alanine ligase
MQLIKTVKEMQAWSRQARSKGGSIGFVPTMGALHEGHMSLLRRSTEENDVTVASIFVNPTQFGPGEDFNRYPKDHKGDMEKISALNVQAVFLPDVAEIYPKGFSTFIYVGGIGNILCGASRPDHFNGVATVVTKLFNIITPDVAYFGQKDFQQTVVIQKLVRELGFDIEIVVCPIVRESDGLAMSSRNTYLDEKERKAALVLYESLKLGQKMIESGSVTAAASVKNAMSRIITSEPLAAIDYVTIVDIHTLEEVTTIELPLAICIAATIGNTRLIDNLIVDKE